LTIMISRTSEVLGAKRVLNCSRCHYFRGFRYKFDIKFNDEV